MRLPVRNNPSTAATEANGNNPSDSPQQDSSLIKRTIGELASINGVASPGAEFLRSGPLWLKRGGAVLQEDIKSVNRADINGKVTYKSDTI
uniref:WGS project CBMG000000000 data, contig CS5907-c001892 n=1 Tax=Fusarium acuminatum CS5907 TaxID=1318461 RepID=A0A090M9D6_9HYPO|nr:unnamed protein product [Fusarium acuminatum CS5907]